jgi:ATP-dependent RNA helicase DDX3X
MGLNDSVHANGNPGNAPGQQRAAYIPPHMRGKVSAQAHVAQLAPQAPVQQQAPMTGSRWASAPTPAERLILSLLPPMSRIPTEHSLTSCSNGGRPAGGWATAPAFTPQAGNNWDAPGPRPQRSFDTQGSSAGGYGGRVAPGEGAWRDGKHIPGPANARLERDLFGVPNDPTKQQSGINFEKYDDIPVEASGSNVPEPVTSFTSPPLDPHLLLNIELAHYKSPTPVQKYSIPIVAAGRDLMACAQTGTSTFLHFALSSPPATCKNKY